MRHSSAISILVLLATGTPTVAQVNSRTLDVPVIEAHDIAFRPISTTGGFTRTRVQQIVQDDQGFLWFGTINGLLRYDGYEYKRFDHDPTEPNSLGGVFVQSLFKDHSGILWIGCDQFLDRFDPKTETFAHYRIESHEPEGLTDSVNHISEDHDGTLWLSTGNGLYKLEPATGRMTRYAHEPSDPDSLRSNNVKSSGEDRSGSFWVADGEGLDAFDRDTGKVILHIPLEEQRNVWFYEDRQGIFWVYSTSARGLAVLDRQRKQLTRFSLHGPGVGAPPGVSAILEDRDGTLWFGTGNSGLLKFDREHFRFIQYRNDRDDSQSLAGNTVALQSLFEDREGHIWVALEGALPTVFTRRPSPFERLPVGPQGASTVTSLFEDLRGTLWVGYFGALTGFESKTGRQISLGPTRQNLAVVQAMAEDHEGGLWAGTVRGLSRLDPRSADFKSYRHDPASPFSLSNDVVDALLVDRDGVLWIATDDGLNRYDQTTDRYATYRAFAEGGNLRYRALTEDQQGALWLASNYSGVHRFDPTTSKFTVYLHKDDQPGSLSNNRVNAVHVDHSGTVWVGTQSGLNRFDPAQQSFSAYYEKDGLSGNVVNCILEDAHGNLWMSTNAGLSAYDPTKRTFRNYSVADGLPASDLTAWKPCFKNRNGRMFFSGFAGAIAFDPESVVNNSFVPPVVLTDLRVSGVPMKAASSSASPQSVTQGGTITLSHQQNNLTLEFSALGFISPETHRYRYRLDGLDRNWNEVDSGRRAVTYSGLPAGAYVFRAQAALTPGVWGEPGASLDIRILPAWWRTSWFLALSVAAIAASVWGGHRLRLRIVEKHQREISALNERLMKAQEQERIRISGELHDGLIQEMLAVTMMLGTAKRRIPAESDAKATIDKIQDKMIRVGTDIRRLSHDLHPPILQEAGLPKALQSYCDEFSATSGIAVLCEADESASELSRGAALALFRIVQEALGNVAKHAHAKRITVRLARSAGEVSLAVSDDGVGFDSGRLGTSGGLGLITMRERAGQLNGTFEFESAPGRGTTIRVVIPFR